MQFEKQIFEPGVKPMEFVSMDLIGEFHPPSSKGNRYALTAVCMLTDTLFAYPSRTSEQRKLQQPGETTSLFRLVFPENY